MTKTSKKIEEELSGTHAATADEAHELLISKHAEILKFLSSIAKKAILNSDEEKILEDVKKYLEQLKSRHFLIRG